MQRFVGLMMPRLMLIGLSAIPAIFAANTAGTLDPTFGSGGVAAVNLAGGGGGGALVTLQADGRILVLAQAGSAGSKLFRFTSAGALDQSFGASGVVTLSPPVDGSMMLQPNGQIVIAGLTTNRPPA